MEVLEKSSYELLTLKRANLALFKLVQIYLSPNEFLCLSYFSAQQCQSSIYEDLGHVSAGS